jgi:hypothetical protein
MKQTGVKELVDKMKQTDDKVDLFAYSLGLKDGAKRMQGTIPSIIENYLETAFISKEQGYMNPK